jgi:UDP-N-acetylglucosamine 1-carboxyvinyltransferase
MEDSYIINGGKALKGEVMLSGAKNVAVKALIAALLFEGEVVLQNIPRIRDVFELLDLLKELGAEIDFTGHTVKINGDSINTNKSDFLHSSKIRTSFMLFAPLLYKFKEAYIPNPGGCRIGARPIDRVVDGMEELGIEVEYDPDTGYYHAEMKNKPKGSYTFKKSSHTVTELLILISVFSDDKVKIENAAMEPEIDDLIRFLNESGAKITRSGSSIIIQGVQKLKQTQPYTIGWDRIEAATYAVLAVITKGDIVISKIEDSLIKVFNDHLVKAGGGVEKLPDGRWRYFYKGPLKATNVTTSPHPGFMTDWQPPWAVLMTQAEGESIIHERIYENRFMYVEELRKMGADIEFIKVPVTNPAEYFFFNFDPAKKYNQVIRINGPQKLHNAVLTVADLRAGATLAIAALSTEGESVLNGTSIMERGYEDFVGKITALGGDIRKV